MKKKDFGNKSKIQQLKKQGFEQITNCIVGACLFSKKENGRMTIINSENDTMIEMSENDWEGLKEKIRSTD